LTEDLLTRLMMLYYNMRNKELSTHLTAHAIGYNAPPLATPSIGLC